MKPITFSYLPVCTNATTVPFSNRRVESRNSFPANMDGSGSKVAFQAMLQERVWFNTVEPCISWYPTAPILMRTTESLLPRNARAGMSGTSIWPLSQWFIVSEALHTDTGSPTILIEIVEEGFKFGVDESNDAESDDEESNDEDAMS